MANFLNPCCSEFAHLVLGGHGWETHCCNIPYFFAFSLKLEHFDPINVACEICIQLGHPVWFIQSYSYGDVVAGHFSLILSVWRIQIGSDRLHNSYLTCAICSFQVFVKLVACS